LTERREKKRKKEKKKKRKKKGKGRTLKKFIQRIDSEESCREWNDQ
jgi:hypothetical protein